VPLPVVVEVDHLVRKRVGADVDRQYADLNLGVVDGCVMAIDERLYQREVG
jgi:hypothetical protein